MTLLAASTRALWRSKRARHSFLSLIIRDASDSLLASFNLINRCEILLLLRSPSAINLSLSKSNLGLRWVRRLSAAWLDTQGDNPNGPARLLFVGFL